MSGYTEKTIARGSVLGEHIIFIKKAIRPGLLSRTIQEVLDAQRLRAAAG